MLGKMLAEPGAGIGMGVPNQALDSLRGLDALSVDSASHFAQVDAAALSRVHLLLIADHQIFPESCLLRLQRSADIASEWALASHQEYHVSSPDKTAILLLGGAARPEVYNASPVVLCGTPIPCTLTKKFAGIVWDHQLSFLPFLVNRVAAARSAFRPVLALAVEGLIPLSELREVIRAKVEGASFYGAMFTFMAPGAADRLDDLQVEFERSLLSALKWFARSLARAVGGWMLCWGERLCFEVMAFRAELWCCSASLLVRQAWDAAQLFPGRTFARCSRGLLIELDVPEVFNFHGWSEFIDDAEPVLNNYKAHIRSVIEQRGAAG